MPKFDVWVCQGRACTAQGSEPLTRSLRQAIVDEPAFLRCTLLRGGCYGMCAHGPNVVVRRYEDDETPRRSADTLALTQDDNETVYVGVTDDEVGGILRAHVDEDRPLSRPHRVGLERNDIAARLHALRLRRGTVDD